MTRISEAHDLFLLASAFAVLVAGPAMALDATNAATAEPVTFLTAGSPPLPSTGGESWELRYLTHAAPVTPAPTTGDAAYDSDDADLASDASDSDDVDGFDGETAVTHNPVPASAAALLSGLGLAGMAWIVHRQRAGTVDREGSLERIFTRVGPRGRRGTNRARRITRPHHGVPETDRP